MDGLKKETKTSVHASHSSSTSSSSLLLHAAGSLRYFYRCYLMCLNTPDSSFFPQQLTQTLFSHRCISWGAVGPFPLWTHAFSVLLQWTASLGLNVYSLKRESNEKYISVKTPWPFTWPLWCIYNHFFTASQQSEKHGQIKLQHVTFSKPGTAQHRWAYRNLPEGRLECRKYPWQETSGSFGSLWPMNLSWELHLDQECRRLSLRGEEAPTSNAAEQLSKPHFEFLITLEDTCTVSREVEFPEELSSCNFHLLPLEFRIQILCN